MRNQFCWLGNLLWTSCWEKGTDNFFPAMQKNTRKCLRQLFFLSYWIEQCIFAKLFVECPCFFLCHTLVHLLYLIRDWAAIQVTRQRSRGACCWVFWSWIEYIVYLHEKNEQMILLIQDGFSSFATNLFDFDMT